jgi:predicted O-methyltransferase YrrM
MTDGFGTREFLQETWIKVQEKYADRQHRHRSPCQLKSEDDWEQRLHAGLNAPWPCEGTSDFWNLWGRLIAELEAAGIQAGPASFRSYNDGDAGLLRTIWCLVRHLRPDRVIETGVAHGLTSRVILEALESNRAGHLWSIDLPPRERVWQKQVGTAVGGRFADRWSYMRGSSRRLLPDLLSRVGQIDLFIHDSLHSERNVLFELDQACAAVRPGGAIVVDDIDVNGAFQSFTEGVPGFRSMICEAEPIRPDLRRFNHKGLFGIILKSSGARTAMA